MELLRSTALAKAIDLCGACGCRVPGRHGRRRRFSGGRVGGWQVGWGV